MKLVNRRYVEIGASGKLYDQKSATEKSVEVAHVAYGDNKVDDRPYCIEHDCLLQSCRYDHHQIDDLRK